MIRDVDESDITITNKPTIGERLSHTRQEKKLTIADIASQLRLTRQTIELIEKEQWGELHGRAYARGYFSSYVKYLGLPEDELLAAFDTQYVVAEPPLRVIQQKIEINSKKMVWLPSLLLVAMAAIGWFVYQQIQVVPEELVPEEYSTLFSDSAALIEESNQASDIVAADEKQQVNDFEQQVNPDAELLINDELTKEGVSDNPEIVIEQQQADSAEIDQLQPQPQPTQEMTNNDVTIDNTTTTVATDAVLDLRFSDDCWVQVKDADNKILLGKLMTKNNSIVLTGRAPFTVVLGRASAVQIIFNDKEFDPSNFTHKNVAQFTLGAES